MFNYVFEVIAPRQSKPPWDYDKLLKMFEGDAACMLLIQSRRSLDH